MVEKKSCVFSESYWREVKYWAEGNIKFTTIVGPPRVDNRPPIQPLGKTEMFVNITSFAFKNV
jgi:hypothetical protein